MDESLFSELKRRNVFKVATAYIVLAWVVIQVTSEAVVAFGMPDWVNTVVFFFGLIGFPFVMLFAWAFELTPEGIKRESEVERDESITQNTGQKLNYIIMGLLAVGMGYFIYESRFQPETMPEVAETEPAASEPAPDTEQTSATTQEKTQAVTGSSIAVLPFVNMSSDPEQEFFSDGISEEILNVLAKIPNLHVTSRSSAFAFKGKEINLSEVADKLGVANILEGSVRKSGNKIRITAQLIEAGSDKHLWSETYDRELNDIFAIQDEISGAIVTALKEKLGVTEVNLIAATTVDLAAHEAYLRGRYFLEIRQEEQLNMAVAEFDKAISIQPDYAQAWMAKAWATSFLSEYDYGAIPNAVAMERAQAALDRAMALDPNLPENYGIQGLIHSNLKEFDKAYASYEKAIELNPNYSNAYTWYGKDLNDGGGDHQKAFQVTEMAYRLDPISVLAGNNFTIALLRYGRYDEAELVIDRIYSIDPNHFMVMGMKSVLLRHQKEYGRSAYYMKKAYETDRRTRYLNPYTNSLASMGLIDEAIQVARDSEYPELQYGISQNQEMLISSYRQKYPRSENDQLGYDLRGMAEFVAKNFEEAIFFYNQSNLCDDCDFLILSHKMLGNEDIYREMLDKRWEEYRKTIEEPGFQLFWHVENKIDLLLMDDRIDEAVQEFSQLLDKEIPISHYYKFGWDLEPLHAHEKWPELLQRSKVIADREQAIYLSLIEQASSNSL